MTGPLTDSAVLPARSFRAGTRAWRTRRLLQQGRDGLHSDRVLRMPDGFTRYWTPGPNFRPSCAPSRRGITPQFVARANTSAGDNVRQTWETYLATGGWWGPATSPRTTTGTRVPSTRPPSSPPQASPLRRTTCPHHCRRQRHLGTRPSTAFPGRPPVFLPPARTGGARQNVELEAKIDALAAAVAAIKTGTVTGEVTVTGGTSRWARDRRPRWIWSLVAPGSTSASRHTSSPGGYAVVESPSPPGFSSSCSPPSPSSGTADPARPRAWTSSSRFRLR